MNVIGWILVIVGLAGLLTSIAGILYILLCQPIGGFTDPNLELYLQDTYYVISGRFHTVWPLILCAALSVAIGVVGYMHTDQFAVRVVPSNIT